MLKFQCCVHVATYQFTCWRQFADELGWKMKNEWGPVVCILNGIRKCLYPSPITWLTQIYPDSICLSWCVCVCVCVCVEYCTLFLTRELELMLLLLVTIAMLLLMLIKNRCCQHQTTAWCWQHLYFSSCESQWRSQSSGTIEVWSSCLVLLSKLFSLYFCLCYWWLMNSVCLSVCLFVCVCLSVQIWGILRSVAQEGNDCERMVLYLAWNIMSHCRIRLSCFGDRKGIPKCSVSDGIIPRQLSNPVSRG